MILIDGSYLYELGKAMHPLHAIGRESTYGNAWAQSFVAAGQLDAFINKSIYTSSIRLLTEPGCKLLEALEEIDQEGGFMSVEESRNKKLSFPTFNKFSSALNGFETIFQAEFKNGNMFLVTRKGGFETRALIENGFLLFPSSLPLKVPGALQDIKQGTKCLAFEVYTAAGFHLHRAHESVIKHYYSQLAGRGFADNERNMGQYIKKLKEVGAPQHILSCLRDLKDMHRNPLMHPDQSIESDDDAIALLNAIHTSINGMLKEIPDADTVKNLA